jgi:hypothetical protein
LGVTKCQPIVCHDLLFFFFSPEGKKFRSRRELKTFLLETNLFLNADDFDFSVTGKGVTVEGRIAACCMVLLVGAVHQYVEFM